MPDSVWHSIDFFCRAPHFDYQLPSVTQVVSSNQMILRHIEGLTYRCFIPDLTGFISFYCEGSNSQRHFPLADLKPWRLDGEFNPATADCRLQGTANSPSSTAMAERKGFEPSIEFPLYTRSRRAPSTTRPPVRPLAAGG